VAPPSEDVITPERLLAERKSLNPTTTSDPLAATLVSLCVPGRYTLPSVPCGPTVSERGGAGAAGAWRSSSGPSLRRDARG
jgi:hypothetical protein